MRDGFGSAPHEIPSETASNGHRSQRIKRRVLFVMVSIMEIPLQLVAEPEAHYDSEMAANQARKPKSTVAKNIALMKQWAKEGK